MAMIEPPFPNAKIVGDDWVEMTDEEIQETKIRRQNMLQSALSYLKSGLTPLPAIRAKKRPSIPLWKQYQSTRPTERQIEEWFANADAVCLLTGQASGNLELIDFDFKAELFDEWCAKLPADLLNRLVIETSQSGGKHVIYRCVEPIGCNLVIVKNLIETRGDGGLFLCAPTEGYGMVQGMITALPIITADERAFLLRVARSMDE